MTAADATGPGRTTGRPIFLPPSPPTPAPPAPADLRPDSQDYVLPGRDDEVIRIRGRLLGFASSQRDEHDHDVTYDAEGRPLTFAPPGERCSACRWFEVRIFSVDAEISDGTCTCGAGTLSRATLLQLPKMKRSEDPADHYETCGTLNRRGRYLVVTAGKTSVPGEVEMRRAEWTDSPFEVVELLTQRKRNACGEVVGSFLPAPSARVLARAAAKDDGIKDAYVNRAVV